MFVLSIFRSFLGSCCVPFQKPLSGQNSNQGGNQATRSHEMKETYKYFGDSYFIYYFKIIIIPLSIIVFLFYYHFKATIQHEQRDQSYESKFNSLVGLNLSKSNIFVVDSLVDVKITFLNTNKRSVWNSLKNYDIYLEQINHNKCNDPMISSLFYPIETDITQGQFLTMIGYINFPSQSFCSSACEVSWRLFRREKRQGWTKTTSYNIPFGQSTPIYSISCIIKPTLSKEALSHRIKVREPTLRRDVHALRSHYNPGISYEEQFLKAWGGQYHAQNTRQLAFDPNHYPIFNPSLVYIRSIRSYLVAFRWYVYCTV